MGCRSWGSAFLGALSVLAMAGAVLGTWAGGTLGFLLACVFPAVCIGYLGFRGQTKAAFVLVIPVGVLAPLVAPPSHTSDDINLVPLLILPFALGSALLGFVARLGVEEIRDRRQERARRS